MTTPLSAALQHVNATSEAFVASYYGAWDKDRPTLAQLYRPQSRVVWNGNPISGQQEMVQLVDKMPASKHEIQAFDCHPLPGTSGEGNMTSIVVTVSGTVLFYNASEGMPAQAPPRQPGAARPRRDPSSREEDIDNLPRLFSHSFILSPDVSPEGTKSYVVQSETFRFVG